MRIQQFVVDPLGDASYMVIAGSEAAVIDPQRDVRPFLEAARAAGAEIRYVFETHVHNDYVSGGPELAARGAEIVAPAEARLEFPHRAVRDGDEVAFGGIRLRAVHAPGHTYEHTAYLVIDEEGKVAGAFTGGAILMAAAGRTDLLGPDHTEELTRLQWETAHRLAGLLDPSAEVLPTHGAGSFCSSAGIGGDRRAPLSVELQRNPILTSPSYEAFRALHLASPAPIPAYYQHMAPINRRGAEVYGEPPVPPLLHPEAVREFAWAQRLIDVRARSDFVLASVPGAFEVEESNSMLAYLSWLVPFNAPLALITYDEAQARRVTTDLFRIGFERVRGYLPFARWLDANLETASLPTVSVSEAAEILRVGKMPVLDVRHRNELAADPLPGALQHPFEDIARWAEDVPKGPLLLVCASGQRATIAASFLRTLRHDAIPLLHGGAADIRAK